MAHKQPRPRDTMVSRPSASTKSTDPLHSRRGTSSLLAPKSKPRDKVVSSRTQQIQHDDIAHSFVTTRGPKSVLRDTSRPFVTKRHPPHQSLCSAASSPLSTEFPFRHEAMARLDSDTYSQSQGSDGSSNGMHPWGDVKARGGRGDLVATGQTQSTQREITLALALTSISWVTGRFGLEWLFWPEEDEYTLGECITHCWELVQDQQERDGFDPHPLDFVVARKMRDYISEKRTLLMQTIRSTVWLEFANHPEQLNETTKDTFWIRLLKDHSVLSPDPNRPGYKKWTSDVVVKCLVVFFRTPGTWALVSYATAREWWNPIPAHTIVIVCSMILYATEAKTRGGRVQRLDASLDYTLFFKVKNSWQNMSDEKQLVLRKILTKKVQRLVETNREPADATPVPNEWDNTLDDLFDDPDFKDLIPRDGRDIEQEADCEDNAAVDDALSKANGDREASGNDEPGGSLLGKSFLLFRWYQDHTQNSHNDDRDSDCLPEVDEMAPTTKERARRDSVLSHSTLSVEAALSNAMISRKRKIHPDSSRTSRQQTSRPPIVKKKMTRNARKISIRFDDGEDEFPYKVPITCEWGEFTTMVNRQMEDMLFWSKPEDWIQFGRKARGTAMCDNTDLAKMLEQAESSSWEYVQVYDATGQFPNDPEDSDAQQ